MTKKKDLNYIASVEQAISKKYGDETVQNPKANWDETKEIDYLQQMKEFYEKTKRFEESQEKVKFDCCHKCYIQYVEDREERWIEGWRPNEDR